ncbi:hypothetical protein BCY86_08360 [Pajaroellobacter abortibovis]|uniref:Peptidase S49 domain-containing protein n=1 Tax=Pajaroellobacter abortibovis TaxID=1882918 RepID=A0A1L6MYZ5_9BACT|nr:S49 family peptidase [Pajaroellobacter abortibovis]APS00687.1 hypothetical protein BCY86_08360 [Pajaroellobacter abortibovis]
MLQELGIKAEFVGIGEHKKAPEQFMWEEPNPVAREDHEDGLRQTEANFVRTVSCGRWITESQLHEEANRGPFTAQEDKQAKLVDRVAFDDELTSVIQTVVGCPIPLQPYRAGAWAPNRFGPRQKIALLYVEGDMINDQSKQIPIVNLNLAGASSLTKTIQQLREDAAVRTGFSESKVQGVLWWLLICFGVNSFCLARRSP